MSPTPKPALLLCSSSYKYNPPTSLLSSGGVGLRFVLWSPWLVSLQKKKTSLCYKPLRFSILAC